MRLLHMYHLSVLPPKQHKIPLIVSRQIRIANVSPNLTDAYILFVIMRKFGNWQAGLVLSSLGPTTAYNSFSKMKNENKAVWKQGLHVACGWTFIE